MTTAYRDWQDRKIQVSDQTLEAVLAVLGAAPPPARARPGAVHGRSPEPLAAPWHPADHPAAPSGPRSGWGFTVQLYSVRSRQSWGHGDLRDLADLAAWSASDLGAGFVLINPLHAAEPLPPLSPSPYLPMSRRFTSPLYLRIEDIPEYAVLSAGDRQRIAALAAPLRAGNSSPCADRPRRGLARRSAPPSKSSRPSRWPPRDGPPSALHRSARARRLTTGPPGARSRRSTGRTGGRGRPLPVAALGGGGRRAGAAAPQDRVPLLAAVGRPGAAGRGAGGGPGGRYEHRRDRRPGGGRAPRRGRRLGGCGRAGGGHERGRAARRVQPAWPGLEPAAVASRQRLAAARATSRWRTWSGPGHRIRAGCASTT